MTLPLPSLAAQSAPLTVAQPPRMPAELLAAVVVNGAVPLAPKVPELPKSTEPPLAGRVIAPSAVVVLVPTKLLETVLAPFHRNNPLNVWLSVVLALPLAINLPPPR